MVRYANAVWEGRFQPIHRGHLAYIELLLERADHVWLVVVFNETSAETRIALEELPVPEFTRAVDPHHRSEKNPLPFWVRYQLVQRTIREELGDERITVWGGHRMDLDWDAYARSLPPDRVFLTPLRDSFEDVKASAWSALGERVERVDVSGLPEVSATAVRDELRRGGDARSLLAPSTVRLLAELGYPEL